jgi:hypothetical protein
MEYVSLQKAHKAAIFGQNLIGVRVSSKLKFVPISLVFAGSLCATDARDGFVQQISHINLADAMFAYRGASRRLR